MFYGRENEKKLCTMFRSDGQMIWIYLRRGKNRILIELKELYK